MKTIDFPLLKMGILIAALYLALNFVFDIDLFEKFVMQMEKLESTEIDEIILVLLILLPLAVIDFAFYRLKKKKIEAERDIFKSMNYVAHHVLNNLLNQLHIMRLEAEHIENFDEDVIEMFDSSIEEAKESLKKLSGVTELNATSIKNSVLP
ncbi:hypothetical protein ACFQ1M_06220 [Sungkyunkwania multivorans]|uniref:Uncharacterized protein n=1 Tax=Sungkyunkwania multivorans TaxID=1173618 RepID=A0ABW3CXD6_9FLAO